MIRVQPSISLWIKYPLMVEPTSFTSFSRYIENLFNEKWNETQFNTESRLKDEPDPVSEFT
jgi:hypothetical protein